MLSPMTAEAVKAAAAALKNVNRGRNAQKVEMNRASGQKKGLHRRNQTDTPLCNLCELQCPQTDSDTMIEIFCSPCETAQ